MPTATVKAAYSKNRHKAVQPLPPDVAEALRGYMANRPVTGPLWSGTWHEDAAEMLRIDLEAANIPFRDAVGRMADFHALRHSCITLLERSGVSPKLAQELARHSDIRLTMNVYTHARLHDLAGAVEGLPALLPVGSESKAKIMRATGTDGKSHNPVASSLRSACARIDSECNSVRAVDNASIEVTRPTNRRKSLRFQAVESSWEPLRADEGNLRRRGSQGKLSEKHLLAAISMRCEKE